MSPWLESLNRVYADLTRYRWVENLISVLAILAGTLVIWLRRARATRRSRTSIQELLATAHHSLDPPHVAAAHRRLTALRLVYNAAKYFLFGCALALVLGRLGFKLDSLV